MNTVSLDLAKKLHAIGYRGETHWMYARYHHALCRGKKPASCKCEFELICEEETCDYDGECNHDRDNAIPAPNATDLFRDMPEYTYLTKLKKGFQVIYEDQDSPTDFKEHADTPSEALGLLYLALHEKGIIK